MISLPLKGIRIADFGQIIAVPYTAQMLAWLGAEVILIENEQRLTTRIWPPFAEAEPGVNRSGGFGRGWPINTRRKQRHRSQEKTINNFHNNI